MRDFVIDTETYSPWNNFDKKEVPTDCNDITFINKTDGVVFINTYPLDPNDSYVSTGNENENNKTRFNISNGTSTTGSLYVLRKRFI